MTHPLPRRSNSLGREARSYKTSVSSRLTGRRTGPRPIAMDRFGGHFGRVEFDRLFAAQPRLFQRDDQRLLRIDLDIRRDAGAFPVLAGLDVERTADRHPHREIVVE